MPEHQPDWGLLARWYAAPLDEAAARRLLVAADARSQSRLRRGQPCRVCSLMRLAARHWLGAPTDADYAALRVKLAGSAHGRLLLDTLYGQLLMAERRPGAFEHLQHAFTAAHHLLKPGDYFTLLHRLDTLRHLPPTTEAVPPASLEQLLTTALVVRRLSPVRPSPPAGDPGDMHG